MAYEFEGRTEKEAIDKAVKELGLRADQDFDVEILESQKGGFFKKGYVKLRIHTTGDSPKKEERSRAAAGGGERFARRARGGSPRSSGQRREGRVSWSPPKELPAENEFEQAMVDFGFTLLQKMGLEKGRASIIFRKQNKLGLTLDSPDSSLLIGRKGKALDAMQLLFNNYAAKLGQELTHIVIDCEGYRWRREGSLVRLAFRTADRVRQTRSSILLDPMNPFDRRLIHTTLSGVEDVDTESEGEGSFKQVRVFFREGRG